MNPEYEQAMRELADTMAPAFALTGLDQHAILNACGIPDERIEASMAEGQGYLLLSPDALRRLVDLLRAHAAQRATEAQTLYRAADAAADAAMGWLTERLTAAEQQRASIEWLALQHVPSNAKDN